MNVAEFTEYEEMLLRKHLKNYSLNGLASLLGRPRSTVARHARMLDLPLDENNIDMPIEVNIRAR